MMHFLQNEIWWLLFAICEFLVILIGLRERFRLRLLYTPYFRASAIVAIVLIILWIGIATTIAIMLGWLAASICLLLSLITGMMISLAFKRDDLDTIAERLDSLRDIAVLRAMHREEVRALLDAYDKNGDDLIELYIRISRGGLPPYKTEKAIRNIELLKWYFQVPDTNTEDIALRLVLWARYGKKYRS